MKTSPLLIDSFKSWSLLYQLLRLCVSLKRVQLSQLVDFHVDSLYQRQGKSFGTLDLYPKY